MDDLDRLLDVTRLQALQLSGLLDTKPDYLRQLVRFAVETMGVDAAQVNVLDDHEQRSIAQWPDGPGASYPARSSGCAYVVQANSQVSVDDTLANPVFCELPWRNTYRGYLGSPLHHRGEAIGAFCVLSVEPRLWSDVDRRMLSRLTDLASRSISEVDL